jgi:UDP-glucose 4-epimerase
MRILITGGSGFVGHHITEELLNRGYNVAVFDIKEPKFRSEFIKGDITDYQDVEQAVKEGDVILHLTALAKPGLVEEDPVPAINVNVNGTMNVIKAAIENKAKKIIYSSTGSVYAIDAKMPIDENSPTVPYTMYGLTKLWGEQLLAYYKSKMPYAILRYPNVYGPGKPWGPGTFLSMLKKKDVPTIFSGKQQNDFTYIGDVVQANVKAIERDVEGVFNIGTGKARSVLDLFNASAKALGSDIKPKIEPAKSTDFALFVYDISKAKKELGYEPRYGLEEGIEETVRLWDKYTDQ